MNLIKSNSKLTSFFSSQIIAFSASSLSQFINMRIFLSKFVTATALLFSCIDSLIGFATKSVLSTSYLLKMIWIYARSISAKMIKLESFFNWTSHTFIKENVSSLHFTKSIITTVSISSAGCPRPTGWSLFNFCPESFFQHKTIPYNELPILSTSIAKYKFQRMIKREN